MGMTKRYLQIHPLIFILFLTIVSMILVIGPVFHNHSWQFNEPIRCPAFLLEQVLSSGAMLFLIIFLFFYTLKSEIIQFTYFPLKSFQLSFVQINRPPPPPVIF